MPNWKKLIYSGSAAVLSNVSASSFTGSFTGSFLGTSSYSANSELIDGFHATAFVTNNVTGSMLAPYLLISNTGSMLSPYTPNSQTGSFVRNNQTSSFVINSQTSSFVQNSQTSSMLAPYLLISNTGSMLSPYLITSRTSSFATTGSGTFSGSIIISSSMAIGTSSLGPSENTLTLGARDTVNEGGQIGFNAPGGTYTSASFIDLYQNRLRILKGTNTSSVGEVANWSMHTLQMSLPAYTSPTSFTGTSVANLEVDSGGNIITTSPVTPVTGYTGIVNIMGNPPGQQNLDFQNGLLINVF